MFIRRLLSLFLVASTTASTCACGTTTTVDLRSDPEGSEVRTRFVAGDPVEITGYTRISDGHREWKGVIQLAPPDSVRFAKKTKKSATTSPYRRAARLEFRIARADLASVDIEGYDTVPLAWAQAAVPGSSPATVSTAPDTTVSDPAPAPDTTDPAPISVVTTSPGRRSNRGKERALTIGIFVALVGAAVVGYSIAGQ